MEMMLFKPAFMLKSRKLMALMTEKGEFFIYLIMWKRHFAHKIA